MQCSLFTCLYECAAQDKDANYNARTFCELIQTCPLRPLPEKKNMTVPVSNHEVQKKYLRKSGTLALMKLQEANDGKRL